MERQSMRLVRLGGLLARGRKKLGLTQAEAVTLFGSDRSQGYIAQFEVGKVTNPSVAQLQQFSRVYDIPYLELVAAVVVDKYEVSPLRAALLSARIGELLNSV